MNSLFHHIYLIKLQTLLTDFYTIQPICCIIILEETLRTGLNNRYMITTDTIIKDPNPLLRKKSEKMTLPLSFEDQQLVDSLYEYVINSTDPELSEKHNLQPAVGIAAPQIGVLKQACAIVVHSYDDEGEISDTHEFILVNPVILSKSAKQTALSDGEGCLSILDPHPGYVYRSHKIKVRAYDALSKQEIILEANGYLAIVIQHEIDHLNGILFYDHISNTQPDYLDPKAIII